MPIAILSTQRLHLNKPFRGWLALSIWPIGKHRTPSFYSAGNTAAFMLTPGIVGIPGNLQTTVGAYAAQSHSRGQVWSPFRARLDEPTMLTTPLIPSDCRLCHCTVAPAHSTSFTTHRHVRAAVVPHRVHRWPQGQRAVYNKLSWGRPHGVKAVKTRQCEGDQQRPCNRCLQRSVIPDWTRRSLVGSRTLPALSA